MRACERVCTPRQSVPNKHNLQGSTPIVLQSYELWVSCSGGPQLSLLGRSLLWLFSVRAVLCSVASQTWSYTHAHVHARVPSVMLFEFTGECNLDS